MLIIVRNLFLINKLLNLVNRHAVLESNLKVAGFSLLVVFYFLV